MTQPAQHSLDFTAILASSIHDLKNSLVQVRSLIQQLAQHHSNLENPEFQQLELETDRMNSSLMQLLILYRIDSALFKPDIDEYPVDEILEDLAAQYEPLLKLGDIQLSIACPENLLCFCDKSIISMLLASIINNAQRYCDRKIKLSAFVHDNYTCFCVEDDGNGYPESLLTQLSNSTSKAEPSTGNTGLGLYFATKIAKLHRHGKRHGTIKIDNGSQLGGARFRLFLP